MKRQVLLSVLAAIVVFAVATNVEAGMFGRLSIFKSSCNPCCEPACCEPVGCEPCEPACCEPVCDPCEPICCDPCGRAPFRPFGGFFANLFSGKGCCATACDPCCEVACDPCEPVCETVCDPCEPVCCEPVCDPCGRAPFRPFGGFFANLHKKCFAKSYCNPCEPVCEPCAPSCCN